MTQHILITGGAGYIGSHVARAFAKAGYTPVVIDDLSNGHEWAAQFGPFYEGNIADVALITQICQKYQPVAVAHFAASIEVAESQANPAKYWKNNVDNSKTLFETLAACGVEYAMYASTGAVYCSSATGSALLEDAPQRPANVYGETKLAMEKLIQDCGMKSVGLRFFNAAGASMDGSLGEAHWPETHLIPNIMLGVRGMKPPIKIFGTDYETRDGTCLRDYVHVEDIADAHILALQYLQNGGDTTVCNLGCGSGYSILEIIGAVEKLIGGRIEKQVADRRAGDAAALVADTSRALQVLGWTPKKSLDDIITSAWQWHESDQYLEALAGYVAEGIAAVA